MQQINHKMIQPHDIREALCQPSAEDKTGVESRDALRSFSEGGHVSKMSKNVLRLKFKDKRILNTVI